MNLRIKLSNFRCFRDTDWVEIRPLTVLVGENSTGKSSFLAGLRYLIHSLADRPTASFNQDPYFLGAYDQIAHYRGGSYGRARSFSLGIELDPTFISLSRSPRSTARFGHDPIRIELLFKPESGQPALNKARIQLSDSSLNVHIGEKTTISLTRANAEQLSLFDDSDEEAIFSLSRFSFKVLKYVLEDVRYSSPRFGDKGGALSENDKISLNSAEQIARLLRAISSRVGAGVIASAPVRTRPQRTYEPVEETPTSEGGHAPMLLARVRATSPTQWNQLKASLDRFGKAAGLFDDIKIKRLGKSASDPFQVLIKISGPASNLIDVGYGVSQSLPLVIDLIQAPQRSIFLYQQPEVHLHPSAQAELASFFNITARKRRHVIVAETHSDHFLDRIRMDVRDQKNLRPEQVSILYFERRGLDVVIHQLHIDKSGNIIGSPPSYRAFFIREEFRSLRS